VRFTLATAQGDTVPLYPAYSWQSGQVQNVTLSNFPTGVAAEQLDIELFVDGKKVGDGVVDGDIISKNAIISARVKSRKQFIDLSAIRVLLNQQPLERDEYTMTLDQQDPHHLAHLARGR